MSDAFTSTYTCDACSAQHVSPEITPNAPAGWLTVLWHATDDRDPPAWYTHYCGAKCAVDALERYRRARADETAIVGSSE